MKLIDRENLIHDSIAANGELLLSVDREEFATLVKGLNETLGDRRIQDFEEMVGVSREEAEEVCRGAARLAW